VDVNRRLGSSRWSVPWGGGRVRAFSTAAPTDLARNEAWGAGSLRGRWVAGWGVCAGRPDHLRWGSRENPWCRRGCSSFLLSRFVVSVPPPSGPGGDRNEFAPRPLNVRVLQSRPRSTPERSLLIDGGFGCCFVCSCLLGRNYGWFWGFLVGSSSRPDVCGGPRFTSPAELQRGVVVGGGAWRCD